MFGLNTFYNKLFGPKTVLPPVVLISLDGWGMAPASAGNAISLAKTPNMDRFYGNYPHGQLIASGESVGLPATEVGNSEVGHLTMGVGRVIYQSLKRINLAIEDGSFFDNEALAKAAQHVIQNNSNMHIMGLVGSGNVHSSLQHMYALLQFCKKSKVSRVYLHLFTDGRDAPPQEGADIISSIESQIKLMEVGQIASISGRYYAMDRDARWERIQKTYDALVLGRGNKALDAVAGVKESYLSGKTDEFIVPMSILRDNKAVTINDNDSVIFFNFRVDRARELTMSFVLPDFEQIKVADYGFQLKDAKDIAGQTFTREKRLNNLCFVTMTEYHKSLPVAGVAFPPQFGFPDSLSEIFSKHNIPNLHLAESEKERMVTYYFRGMRAEPFPGEDVVIVPSSKVATYDQKPEMSARQILKEFGRALNKNKYRFILVNLANPDMVAHSGKVDATVKAIEVVDKVLGEMAKLVLDRNGLILITADHGNAEELLTFPNNSFYYTTQSGEQNTDHSSNPVPIIIVGNSLKGKGGTILSGSLADIAPTILAIMKLPIPATMTGRDLLTERKQ